MKSLTDPNVNTLKNGLPNLEKHLENIKQFGLTPVIAINKFLSDSDDEIQVIKDFARNNNIRVALAEVWEKGGKGALDLAQHVIDIVEEESSNFKPLYDWNMDVKSKIEIIAKNIYGADGVEYSNLAEKNLKTISNLDLDHVPVCIAKTQKSLSDDPKLIGRPDGFIIHIREIEIASGAEFLIPISGDMMRMPGLPAHPASENINIDNDGNITGLF